MLQRGFEMELTTLNAYIIKPVLCFCYRRSMFLTQACSFLRMNDSKFFASSHKVCIDVGGMTAELCALVLLSHLTCVPTHIHTEQAGP